MNQRILPLLVICCAIFVVSSEAQEASDQCYRWKTQVDARLTRVEIEEEALSDEQVLVGIRCLLNLQGNQGEARFKEYTRLNARASGRQPKIKRPATVEIGALYYASYIFTKNWEHAGSVQLYDPDTEKLNVKSNVKRAYEGYRRWLKQIETIGLQKARDQELDPLDGTGVQWS